jgi:hypothetical protein
MKKQIATIFFLVFIVLAFASVQVFAVATEELRVSALPPGNLNEVINADIVNGEAGHIYVLEQTGPIDTTYFITEEIRIKNLMIIGITNPNTGHPPVIAPYINIDGSSPGNIAVAIDNGFVHFKNLYLLGTRTDDSQVTQQCISTSDSCRLTVENCIIENFGSTGTPNILNTWNAIGTDIFVTNCLFRCNQSDIPQNPGMNWAGPGVNAIDTMKVTNSTFYFLGGNIEGSGSSMGYLEFDHNTMFMHTKSSPFSMRQMHNAVITNNVFFGVYAAGLDSNHVFDEQVYNANFYSPPAIITLDSLYEQLEGDPYFLTEADRRIEATNNAYFWPAKVMDNFATMNADPGTYWGVGGRLYAPTWVATRPEAEPILELSNIHVAEADNFAMDPGFDAALVEAASDSMARFVRHIWANGGSGVGSRPFVYKASPIDPYAGVASDWANTQGYPVRENLRYTNATLLAADNGKPIGDLNWFPEYNTGVERESINAPNNFTLKQNYPNPFNPVTTIQYYMTSTGPVTLKVFNLSGQEVATLVDEVLNAGEYTVYFDASQLASGVYMYRLDTQNYSVSKKMLLMK